MTAVREEIQEMLLEAARYALEQTNGPMEEEDKGGMLSAFESRIDRYVGRYPVSDLFSEFQAASDSSHLAAVTAGKNMRAKTETHPEGSREAAPITDIWVQAVIHAAEAARKSHFQKAREYFDKGEEGEATEELCKAITCSIATIAARQGWPHQSQEDLGNAVTALALGPCPRKARIYTRCLNQPLNKVRT